MARNGRSWAAGGASAWTPTADVEIRTSAFPEITSARGVRADLIWLHRERPSLTQPSHVANGDVPIYSTLTPNKCRWKAMLGNRLWLSPRYRPRFRFLAPDIIGHAVLELRHRRAAPGLSRGSQCRDVPPCSDRLQPGHPSSGGHVPSAARLRSPRLGGVPEVLRILAPWRRSWLRWLETNPRSALASQPLSVPTSVSSVACSFESWARTLSNPSSPPQWRSSVGKRSSSSSAI